MRVGELVDLVVEWAVYQRVDSFAEPVDPVAKLPYLQSAQRFHQTVDCPSSTYESSPLIHRPRIIPTRELLTVPLGRTADICCAAGLQNPALLRSKRVVRQQA